MSGGKIDHLDLGLACWLVNLVELGMVMMTGGGRPNRCAPTSGKLVSLLACTGVRACPASVHPPPFTAPPVPCPSFLGRHPTYPTQLPTAYAVLRSTTYIVQPQLVRTTPCRHHSQTDDDFSERSQLHLPRPQHQFNLLSSLQPITLLSWTDYLPMKVDRCMRPYRGRRAIKQGVPTYTYYVQYSRSRTFP